MNARACLIGRSSLDAAFRMPRRRCFRPPSAHPATSSCSRPHRPFLLQVKDDGTVSSVEDQLVDSLGKVLGKQEGEWEKAASA